MPEEKTETQRVLDQLHKLDDFWRESYESLEDRFNRLEAKNSLILNSPGDPDNPHSPEAKEFLTAVIQRKAVDMQSATAGGNAAPTILSDAVHAQVRRMSPMVDLVRMESSGTGQFKKIVSDLKHGHAWVGETGARGETGTAGLQLVEPTYGMLYAYPKTTEEAAQDIFFEVQAWFVAETSRAFAQGLGAAIISGNGTDKPTGFLQASTSSTIDGDTPSPERPFGTIQYLPTGAAADFQGDRLSSPQGDPGGVLFDALYALNEAHRANSVWVMNSLTLAKIRKFRDADGNYLFQPGLIAGMDDTLLGRPIRIAEDMPDVGANAFPVALADWEAAYLLVRVGQLLVTVDNNITTPGYIKLYVRQRFGGKLLDSQAIKLVKCATS